MQKAVVTIVLLFSGECVYDMGRHWSKLPTVPSFVYIYAGYLGDPIIVNVLFAVMDFSGARFSN